MLVTQAEGRSNTGESDLQLELETLYGSLREEFAPLRSCTICAPRRLGSPSRRNEGGGGSVRNSTRALGVSFTACLPRYTCSARPAQKPDWTAEGVEFERSGDSSCSSPTAILPG